MKTQGFTLIELLVVVIIVGILAAIAVPQYFKIVEKTRAYEGLSLARQISNAQMRYFQRHSIYTDDLNELDAVMPGQANNAGFAGEGRRDVQYFNLGARGNLIAVANRLPVNTMYFFAVNKDKADELLIGIFNTKYNYIVTAMGGKPADMAKCDAGVPCYSLD